MLPKFQERINAAAQLPPEESIPIYASILEKLGRWSSYPIEEKWPIFNEAQAKLLSIPGHATYYRDKIKALQEQMRTGKLGLEDWSAEKQPYFAVLKQLPSEETVEVLGDFAMDKFAFAFSKNPEDLAVPGLLQYKYSDYSVDFTVCVPAMSALEALGIDDPPVKGHLREDVRQALWSRWWQEVKAGKRKYRFKGSDVLHPVNAPPGAEREVRRPERHPGSTSVAKTLENPASKPTDEVKAERTNLHWPVFAAIVGVLLAGLVYWQRARSRKY